MCEVQALFGKPPALEEPASEVHKLALQTVDGKALWAMPLSISFFRSLEFLLALVISRCKNENSKETTWSRSKLAHDRELILQVPPSEKGRPWGIFAGLSGRGAFSRKCSPRARLREELAYFFPLPCGLGFGV